MIWVEYESNIESTKDTPYLTLTGELWCVFCEDFEKKMTALYDYTFPLAIPTPHTASR